MKSNSSIDINNDKSILAKVAVGDEDAFKHLFEKHHNKLASYIFSVTKSRQTAEEVVQDIFMKIWSTRESLIQISNFDAYLFVISRNLVISFLRKKSSEKKKFEEYVNSQHYDEDDLEISNREFHLDLIDEAIEMLPNQQKKIYFLSRQKHFTYQEIAKELGISHLTVKKHMQLALASISSYVKDHSGNLFFTLWLLLPK